MDSKAAAERLETTPRTLRRFLRSDPHFNNAGAGGKYSFDEADFLTLKKRFTAWRDENAGKGSNTPTKRKLTSDENDPTAMPLEILGRRLSRNERAERDRRSRERVDRLEAALKEKGLHISQMRDREWSE